MANQVDMTPLRVALIDLAVSIVHGLKIFVVYIIPSTIVAVLISPQLMALLSSNPSLLAYAPIANLVFSVVASLIKARLPNDSAIKKIL